MPRYQHDCNECIFVGEDRSRSTKEVGSYVDCYVHKGWREGIAFFTRRWGNDKYQKEEKSLAKMIHMEGGNMEYERWLTARMMANKKGIIV